MRWRQALEVSKGKPNPVLGPWHTFAALAGPDFSRQAPGIAKALPSDDPKVTNPVIAQAFADQPPGTMEQSSRRRTLRRRVLSQLSKRWDEALKADPTRASA